MHVLTFPSKICKVESGTLRKVVSQIELENEVDAFQQQ